MDIVKKNILSILCGVVAIAAIIAWFWPVGGMFDDAAGRPRRAAPRRTHDVETLRTAAAQAAVARARGATPSSRCSTASPTKRSSRRAAEDQGADRAEQPDARDGHEAQRPPAAAAPGRCRCPPRSARTDVPAAVLPRAGAHREGVRDRPAQAARRPRARRSPKSSRRSAQKIWDEKYNPRVIVIGGDNNLDQVTEEFYAEVQDLPEREQQKRASEHLVYLDETSLPVSPSPDIDAGQAAVRHRDLVRPDGAVDHGGRGQRDQRGQPGLQEHPGIDR